MHKGQNALKVNRLFVALAMLPAASLSAQAQIQNILGIANLYANGPCDSSDYIPGWIHTQTKWFSGRNPGQQMGSLPSGDLWILGAALQINYWGVNNYNETEAFSGIANGLGGDVLIPYFTGPGTKQIMFPTGYAMKLVDGSIEGFHVDMHIGCPPDSEGARWEARLYLYTVPAQ